MIKINLVAEKKKQVKARTPTRFKLEGGGKQNMLLAAVVLTGFAVAAMWSMMVLNEVSSLKQQHVEADAELERLAPIIEKANRYEKRKELLERKINLITELKRKQDVPVHILDQVSRNLPEFLWLNSLSTNNNQISINGRATTYNAVSNFYKNLTSSGQFGDVSLGRTFEEQTGVTFSLTASFAKSAAAPAEETEKIQG